MDAANPFAQSPTSPEPIIAQVRRQLLAEAGDGNPVQDSLVEGLVDRAVRDLWESRVKAFVPVLALRDARESLRTQVSAAPPLPPASSQAGALASAVERLAEHSVRDVMGIERDVLSLDPRDVLPVDDRDVLIL